MWIRRCASQPTLISLILTGLLSACSQTSTGVPDQTSLSGPTPPAEPITTQAGTTDPLIEQGNLTYLGAFRLPRGKYGTSTQSNTLSYGYDLDGLSYNPIHHTLFIAGHTNPTASGEDLVTEINIPSVLGVPTNSTCVTTATQQCANNADTTQLNLLPIATVFQNSIDITAGYKNLIKADRVTPISNGALIGGTLLYHGKLIGNTNGYYDANSEAEFSHFSVSPTWTASGLNFLGMFQLGARYPLGTLAWTSGFVAGGMANIPDDWQKLLGYPVLTGMGMYNTINRTSLGPSIWMFNPDAMTDMNTAVPAVALVTYPNTHPNLGSYADTPNMVFNRGSRQGGMVFPKGSRSILVFGRHGLGIDGAGATTYGPASPNISDAGNVNPQTCNGATIAVGDHCAWDPTGGSKGSYGFPYLYRIWAYDANDLLHVIQGDLITSTNNANVISPSVDSNCAPDVGKPFQPYCIKPYAYWNLNSYNAGPFTSANLPVSTGFPFVWNGKILGTAYDDVNQRIYLTTESSDHVAGSEPFSVVHVLSVSVGSAP